MNRTEPRLGRVRHGRRGLAIALGVVAAVAFGYVAVSAFTDSVVYYRTPTEAMAMPGVHLRVSGTVVAGSITSAATQGVSFAVTDGTTTLTVTYPGAPPAALREGGVVVAEGSVGPDGRFQATGLMTRCPSKFDTAGTGG